MSLYQNIIQYGRRVVDNLGFLSTFPAKQMDKIYLEEPKGVAQNTWAFLRIRALSIVFIGLTVIDLMVDLTMTLFYAARTLVTESTQDARLATQKKYATGFGNRLYALLATVLTAGIIWLISPKAIIFYFTRDNSPQSGVRAGGDYHFSTDAIRKQPADLDELLQLINEAMQDGRQIIPIGAGRSQGRQFLPEGNGKAPLVIDLQNFNTVEIDSDAKTATVGAGVLWGDIQLIANKHKLALKVMQASNVFSVGGSLGTNIHGWDHKTGVLSNTIEAIEFINTCGRQQKIIMNDATSEADKELFNHIAGGLGLFGIVYRVTLKLTDNEKLKRHGEEVPLNFYVDYFKDEMQADNVKMHYYRLDLNPDAPLKRGFTETYIATDKKPVVTPRLSLESSRGSRMANILINLARNVGWLRKYYWESERSDALKNNPVLTTNEIMQPPINAMFNPSVSETEWLQEYFLPGDTLPAFLNDLSKIMVDNNVPLLNASVRFVKQHVESPLSYTAGGDRFAVVLCFNQSLQPSKIIQAKKWLRKAQHLALDNGGTYYLPYQHVSSPSDFNRAYPKAQAAQAYKTQIDPNQLFTSGFHQKYIVNAPAQSTPSSIDYVHQVMKNPEWRTEFEGFLTNVLKRVDSKQFYALLDDILTYNDTHAEIYQELCTRLVEIMPSFLVDIPNQLKSLAAIQEDLCKQAMQLIPLNKTLNGIVEVGSPGRFINGFKKDRKVLGNVYVVNETEPSTVDGLINASSIKAYDEFVPFDYHNPHLNNIPSHSADVITCYVGLHHFSPHGLDQFLTEVKRVLREDGQFLLVDHAVGDEKSRTMAMAHFAHFLFNAVNGVSLKDELEEIRDFKPISYWQEKLKEHGLDNKAIDRRNPLIRTGDPTKNCMITAFNSQPELQQRLDDVNAPIGSWRNAPATPSNSSIFSDSEKNEPKTAITDVHTPKLM